MYNVYPSPVFTVHFQFIKGNLQKTISLGNSRFMTYFNSMALGGAYQARGCVAASYQNRRKSLVLGFYVKLEQYECQKREASALTGDF